MRTFVTSAIAAASLCLARAASGEPPQEPLRLQYHAFAGCDDEQQFVAALRSRAPRARLATAGETARIFDVEIAESKTGARAKLTIRESSGRATVREIEAKDCREAVDALALIAALAVDPDAGVAGRASVPAPGDGLRSLVEAPVSTPSDAVGDAATSVVWRWSVAGAARAGLAPGLLFGGRLGVELGVRGRDWLAPSLRVFGEYLPEARFAVEGGVAGFAHAGGGLEICPIRVLAGGALLARPCGLVELGVLQAEGFEVPNPRSAQRFRLAAGLLVRLEWRVAPPMAFELDLGCTFPIRRDRFRFDPLLIYEPSAIALTGLLGATVHFP